MSKLIHRNIHTALAEIDPFITQIALNKCNVIFKVKHERDRGAGLPALSLSREHARQLAHAILEMLGQVAIVWSVEDVIEIAKEKTGGHLVDHEAAMGILSNLQENHDANYGVDWNSLHAEIDNWIEYEFDYGDAQRKTKIFLKTAVIRPVILSQNGDFEICGAGQTPTQWALYYQHYEEPREVLWGAFTTEAEAVEMRCKILAHFQTNYREEDESA